MWVLTEEGPHCDWLVSKGLAGRGGPERLPRGRDLACPLESPPPRELRRWSWDRSQRGRWQGYRQSGGLRLPVLGLRLPCVTALADLGEQLLQPPDLGVEGGHPDGEIVRCGRCGRRFLLRIGRGVLSLATLLALLRLKDAQQLSAGSMAKPPSSSRVADSLPDLIARQMVDLLVPVVAAASLRLKPAIASCLARR